MGSDGQAKAAAGRLFDLSRRIITRKKRLIKLAKLEEI
jgi:hypothetical protein